MTDGFITFSAFIVCMIIATAVPVAKMYKYKIRLRKRDDLIWVMIASLPKLLEKNIDFCSTVDIEYDVTSIGIKFDCSDEDFTCKVYNYFNNLQKHGYRISVNRINGSRRS